MFKLEKKIIGILLVLLIIISQFSLVFAETPNTSVSTARYLGDGKILRANGELWEITSETTAEKIDENVKDYVKAYFYGDSHYEENVLIDEYHIVELILKKDLQVNYKIEKRKDGEVTETETYTKQIKNVKDIGDLTYLTDDEIVYKITGIDENTGELITEKLEFDNVKQLFNSFVIQNDGSVFEYYDKENLIINIGKAEIVEHCVFVFPFDITYAWYTVFFLNDGRIFVNKPVGGSVLKPRYDTIEYTKQEYIDLLNEPWYRFDYETQKDIVVNDFNVPEMENKSYIVPFHGETEFSDNFLIHLKPDGSVYTIDDEKTVMIISPEGAWKRDELIKTQTMKTKKINDRLLINGIQSNKKVSEFKKDDNFAENLELKVFNIKNEPLADEAFIGTGDKLRLYNGDKLVKEYTAIIYGDTDGNGEITAIDALAIIMNRTKKNEFSDIAYVEAGRLESSGDEVPSAIDALAIIMYKTGKYTINQAK